jgi:hypothetical protein
MDMNTLRVLDNLIENYFGQGYDVIDDSNEIGPIIEGIPDTPVKVCKLLCLKILRSFWVRRNNWMPVHLPSLADHADPWDQEYLL